MIGAIEDFARRELEPSMKPVAADARFSFEPVYAYPALDTSADSEAARFAKSLIERNDHAKVAFGTEAGLFSGRAGIPSIVCGPGSIVQAHKPDEFITLDQLALGETFLRHLMDRVCGKRAGAAASQESF